MLKIVYDIFSLKFYLFTVMLKRNATHGFLNNKCVILKEYVYNIFYSMVIDRVNKYAL